MHNPLKTIKHFCYGHCAKRHNVLISIAIVTVIWVLLYLPHLRTSPAWYGDETLTHHTSRNLVQGIPSNLALWNTFWHPHYPYQPAYSMVNGIFATLANGDILGSRFFNTLLALGASLSILLLGRKSFGWKASLFSAVMFLSYDQSIIHFRMSYAHNAAGLGLLIMTLFLIRKTSSSNDWLAGLGLMISAGSHPLFINAAFSALLCRIRKPKSWYRIFLPSFCYLLISLTILLIIFKNFLLEDLEHLGKTFLGRGESDGSGAKGAQNFLHFIGQDAYHIIMVIGILLLIPLKKYAAPIVGLTVLFLLVKNRQNLIVFYYQAIVILPVLALGWAGLWRFVEISFRKFKFNSWIYLLFLYPFFLFLTALPKSFNGTLKPRNFFWVTQSTHEVESAAEWINKRTNSQDFVAANPNIAWLLKARTANYLQIITWYKYPTQGYENGNKRERFRYDSSLENAKFAVVGDIDTRWTFGEPNVGMIPEKFIQEKWPIVWQGENYLILKNPLVE
jgi:hypothetical protein